MEKEAQTSIGRGRYQTSLPTQPASQQPKYPKGIGPKRRLSDYYRECQLSMQDKNHHSHHIRRIMWLGLKGAYMPVAN